MANNETTGSQRLQHLKGSDYEVADGEPDIRGWDVRDENAKHIGKVEELIFDVQARKVRYMVVKLDKDVTNNDTRDVLVPIGLAELHKTDDDAFLPGVTPQQLTSLPSYDGSVTDDMEAKIRSVLAGVGTGAAFMTNPTGASEDFYNQDHFNEGNLFKNRKGDASDATTIPIIEEELNVGKQTVETGGAYIRSRIIEKPAEETISLQEEHVTVERTPVNRPVESTNFDTFKEGVIELKEYAEVPVVTKEARVVEEVIIGKEVNERSETVRDTVRKTEVDVENVDTDKTFKTTTSTDDLSKDNL